MDTIMPGMGVMYSASLLIHYFNHLNRKHQNDRGAGIQF